MKTIYFYSYKGGTGRSMLLKETARYLALAGKNVALIDLDLEAPGLHYKFGINRDDLKKGMIDILSAWQRNVSPDFKASVIRNISLEEGFRGRGRIDG